MLKLFMLFIKSALTIKLQDFVRDPNNIYHMAKFYMKYVNRLAQLWKPNCRHINMSPLLASNNETYRRPIWS